MHFSGFCFNKEGFLFDEFVDKSCRYISSFSCGSIDALEYIVDNDVEIDKLYMFSPSFFDDKTSSFKNSQLKIFQKYQDRYLNSFYENCLYDKSFDIEKYKKIDDVSKLEKLLFYKWKERIFQKVIDKNIEIIVYFGKYDEIINISEAKRFFRNYASVQEITNAGHLLK